VRLCSQKQSKVWIIFKS